MDTFEVCHLWLVTCFYQSIEACLHQLSYAAAENCLLTEEVSFCFFFECSFEDSSSSCADAGSVCQCIILSLAGCILIYSDQ